MQRLYVIENDGEIQIVCANANLKKTAVGKSLAAKLGFVESYFSEQSSPHIYCFPAIPTEEAARLQEVALQRINNLRGNTSSPLLKILDAIKQLIEYRACAATPNNN